MKTLTNTVGRILFSVPFLVLGIFHFVYTGKLAGMLAGWPVPEVFVYIAGAGLLLGAIAIIINRYARLAAWLLALELLIIILGVHVPQLMDPKTHMAGLTAIVKNTGLIGGALMAAGILKN